MVRARMSNRRRPLRLVRSTGGVARSRERRRPTKLTGERATSRNVRVITLITALQFGCASSSGTAPDDMSVAHHEQAAGQEQAVAQQHEQQYDPNQTQSPFPSCNNDGPCWSSVANPTAQHRQDAEDHRELAAKHRAAAQAFGSVQMTRLPGIVQTRRTLVDRYHKRLAGLPIVM